MQESSNQFNLSDYLAQSTRVVDRALDSFPAGSTHQAIDHPQGHALFDLCWRQAYETGVMPGSS